MTLAARLRRRLEATAGMTVPYANDMGGVAEGPGTPAAVLIAVTDRAEPGLILTQRLDTLRRHAGQVAFPGGRVDPEDADAIAAALREAEEEIALSPGLVELVGVTNSYRTVTGFAIVPVLAVIPPDLPLVPHVDEVAAVFEAPLVSLLDPATWTERAAIFEGSERRYLEAMWGERRIWGATAAIIANLAARLQ